MAAPGLEMVVGARRDPDWGPVLMVGLGGIWIEALDDVRLLPADLSAQAIASELAKLRGAALLHGWRGEPARDVEALCDCVLRLGAFIRAQPEIVEIDINPLVLYAKGRGALALDVLLLTSPGESMKIDRVS
jgi:acetate---CoA ligase (ADP-forming)